MDHRIFHVRVSDGRRVVLPAEACRELNIEVGDTLIVDVADKKVELHSFETTLAEFRTLLATKVPKGISLVEELLAERRTEGARE